MEYDKEILNFLLDKFGKSRIFLNLNAAKRSPNFKIIQKYPAYADDSQYDIFTAINSTVEQLEHLGFIQAKRRRGTNVVENITLVLSEIPSAYKYLNRKPKQQKNQEMLQLMEYYAGENKVLEAFYKEQKFRIEQNKPLSIMVDVETLHQILKVLAHIFKLQEDTYRRDFSMEVLGDSKAFEKIESKVKNLLYTYGDFSKKDTIMEELHIVKNPAHMFFKGNAILLFENQQFDLSVLHGDIGLSSDVLQDIVQIDVHTKRIVTIENLTTFHDFCEPDTFAIYLGGYHSSCCRTFILQVYKDNMDKEYFHYGDIDAGGFHIWQHLCQQTKIPFKPLYMDIPTLQKFFQYTKPLTEFDRTRLQLLEIPEFSDVIEYMLQNNCKLEQEACSCITNKSYDRE